MQWLCQPWSPISTSLFRHLNLGVSSTLLVSHYHFQCQCVSLGWKISTRVWSRVDFKPGWNQSWCWCGVESVKRCLFSTPRQPWYLSSLKMSKVNALGMLAVRDTRQNIEILLAESLYFFIKKIIKVRVEKLKMQFLKCNLLLKEIVTQKLN